MRGALALILVLAVGAGLGAHAAPLTPGARLALLGEGSVPACAACHGPRGQGRRHFAYPKLAGLGVAYVRTALRAFADGQRLNGIMTPIARALTSAQKAAVARYYARFRPRPPHVPPTLDRVAWAAGEALYQHGDLADKLVACARCHGRRGRGLAARFPWIAGQRAAYLKEQLRAFRAGARHGLTLGLMRAAARPLTGHQIEEIALYVSTLGARPAVLAPPPRARVMRLQQAGFLPPRRAAVPVSLFGVAVLHGRALFDHTRRYASDDVGNRLSCGDCHLGEGRAANEAPLWAAAVLFPRLYDGHITTLAGRIQAAFVDSENGRPPPLGSPVMTDLLAYARWMSRGAPVGAHMAGRGYPALPRPARAPNRARGARLYGQRCAVCHGSSGQGVRVAGRQVFPPVWGPASFGARSQLARTAMLAAFLEAAMPYGEPETLAPKDAYDLAAFLLHEPRPGA